MNNELILSKEEVMDILCIKTTAFKNILKTNTLFERLKDKGYKYIGRFKEGRTYKYKVVKDNSCKELLGNIAKSMFDTNKVIEFGDYVMYRKDNIDLPITKESLGELCYVSRKTISKWDDKMIEHGLMTKDGFFYVAKDFDDKGNIFRYRLTDKYEYQSYIRNSRFSKMKKSIAEKYKKGDITYDDMELAIVGINEFAKSIENKFVYRVSKFTIENNNILLNQIIELIKLSIPLKEYRQKYLEIKD